MINVGMLKQLIKNLPDDTPIISGDMWTLQHLSAICKEKILWKTENDVVKECTALYMTFESISHIIAYRMFVPNKEELLIKKEHLRSRNCNDEYFTPSTLINELDKKDNFLTKYKIDNTIVDMVKLKLSNNFDKLLEAYNCLIENQNRDVFSRWIDAILCKE